MTNRLEQFVAAARERVAKGTYHVGGAPLTANGSFSAALQGPRRNIIAELKPASPSAGRLLNRSPEEVLADYVWGGAAAISCLADGDHFDGSPELVRLANQTELPVLWKDFVIDPIQIQAAEHCGASAVLLIERILQPDVREALVAEAHELGLEVLLEVHGDPEWQTAKSSNADLIGVNARNLDTLEMDVASANRLVSRIASKGKTVVALSGISDRQSVDQARSAGAAAVLVGTQLMTADDPGLALRALTRPLAKVCGIRTSNDLAAAIDAEADLIGFVVGAPDSPRNIAPLTAQQLSDEAKSMGARTVLVTPHLDDWEVREWCRIARPDYVQLHGLKPTGEWLHSLGAIPTIPIMATTEAIPEPFILDSSAGKGATTTWTAGSAKSSRLSLVAGGLNATNCQEAIVHTQAWGADASSGLESVPGTKDPTKVREFVEACHNG